MPDDAVNLSIDAPGIVTLARFSTPLMAGVRTARLLTERPWVRLLDKLRSS